MGETTERLFSPAQPKGPVRAGHTSDYVCTSQGPRQKGLWVPGFVGVRLPQRREQRSRLRIENGSSQGQNLAFTGLVVPSSLDSGAGRTGWRGFRRQRGLRFRCGPATWRAALRVGPKPGPECEPSLVWQRQIRRCHLENLKSKILDLVEGWSWDAQGGEVLEGREDFDVVAVQ